MLEDKTIFQQFIDGRKRVNYRPCASFSAGGSQFGQSILTEDNIAETSSKTFTKIYKLSDRKLNNTEKSVLLKGLKFTPTPEKSNYNQTENDVNDFCRKLRPKEYFDSNDNTDTSIVRNKKVQVGKDQEKAQSEKYSHSKNRGGKKPN